MAKKRAERPSLVYSTEQGKVPPISAGAEGRASIGKSGPTADGMVRLGFETKGRKGSGVCLISGLPLGPEALKELAQKLKKKCGSGGTVKDGVIEIQGDHRNVLESELQKAGYRVKRTGG